MAWARRFMPMVMFMKDSGGIISLMALEGEWHLHHYLPDCMQRGPLKGLHMRVQLPACKHMRAGDMSTEHAGQKVCSEFKPGLADTLSSIFNHLRVTCKLTHSFCLTEAT
jgi:hypothetical protein